VKSKQWDPFRDLETKAPKTLPHDTTYADHAGKRTDLEIKARYCGLVSEPQRLPALATT
jgi:hypothetical protein